MMFHRFPLLLYLYRRLNRYRRKKRNEGHLLLAGPRPAIDASDPGEAGFLGSLIVARFDSLEDAQKWADADPYVAAGVYESVEVTPFKRVMPV